MVLEKFRLNQFEVIGFELTVNENLSRLPKMAGNLELQT
jgi:hypothetical protein